MLSTGCWAHAVLQARSPTAQKRQYKNQRILLVDKFFQLFARTEEGKLLGLDLNNGTSLGIATGIPFIIFDLEAAKPSDFDTVATKQGFLDGIDEGSDHFGGLVNVHFLLFRQSLDQFALIHGFPLK